MRFVRTLSLLLVLVGCLTLSVFSWQSKLDGTWNLTENAGSRSSASWLKVEPHGSGWIGLYLHRGGHPMPARIEIKGNVIKVQTLAEEGTPTPPNAKFPSLTGTLEDGKLSGTGTDSRGNEFTWTGVRAPDRMEGSDRNVQWGDPIKLFDGKDMAAWKTADERKSQWKAVDGILENLGSGANLRTVQEFRDFKLHVEWKIPKGSNSGIYLRGRYETQVADDYGKEPFPRCVGGIYGQITPSVNPARPAGEWNTVDATLVGYRLTLVVNGKKTVDGQLLPGITGGALDSNEAAPGPILLQGDHGPVSYRNIVLTPAR